MEQLKLSFNFKVIHPFCMRRDRTLTVAYHEFMCVSAYLVRSNRFDIKNASNLLFQYFARLLVASDDDEQQTHTMMREHSVRSSECSRCNRDRCTNCKSLMNIRTPNTILIKNVLDPMSSDDWLAMMTD